MKKINSRLLYGLGAIIVVLVPLLLGAFWVWGQSDAKADQAYTNSVEAKAAVPALETELRTDIRDLREDLNGLQQDINTNQRQILEKLDRIRK